VRNVALKVAIVRAGVTQRGLSVTLGMSEIRLSEIVRGRANASDSEKARIAEALGVAIAEVF
jgi:plasmid maintenance system antidote protein VapI